MAKVKTQGAEFKEASPPGAPAASWAPSLVLSAICAPAGLAAFNAAMIYYTTKIDETATTSGTFPSVRLRLVRFQISKSPWGY